MWKYSIQKKEKQTNVIVFNSMKIIYNLSIFDLLTNRSYLFLINNIILYLLNYISAW